MRLKTALVQGVGAFGGGMIAAKATGTLLPKVPEMVRPVLAPAIMIGLGMAAGTFGRGAISEVGHGSVVAGIGAALMVGAGKLMGAGGES